MNYKTFSSTKISYFKTREVFTDNNTRYLPMPLISGLILMPALASNIFIPRQTQLMAHVHMDVQTLEKDIYTYTYILVKVCGISTIDHSNSYITANY